MANIVGPLRAWAVAELRDLPWRETRDPWHILVSETMLQQTQVARVRDRYQEFLERFPSPGACAAAPTSEVIALWAGLGYNRRAVNLWRAARMVVEHHDGQVPSDLDELLALPGVGPYTARAILVFAFEADVGVLDTNVGRLLARWTGRKLAPAAAQTLADELVPVGDAWMWNQGLFDFAVAVCTKRNPRCDDCPVVATGCHWRGIGPDPAIASAGVSTPQSRFEGSERQVRGRIVDALRKGPLPFEDLRKYARAHDTDTDLERILASLIRDGLVVLEDEKVLLPSLGA